MMPLKFMRWEFYENPDAEYQSGANLHLSARLDRLDDPAVAGLLDELKALPGVAEARRYAGGVLADPYKLHVAKGEAFLWREVQDKVQSLVARHVFGGEDEVDVRPALVRKYVPPSRLGFGIW